MKEYLKFIILGMLLVFALGLIVIMYQNWTTKAEDPRITEAKVETQVRNIYWYSTAYKIAFILILIVCLICIVMLTYSIAMGRLKKAAVHTYKVGKHSEIVVHEKDLSLAAPVAMGLVEAEKLKQMNKGVAGAFDMYTKMAEVQTKQIQALVGKKGVAPGASSLPLSAQEAQALPAAQSLGVPTFKDLLLEGEIAPGKSMILGYQSGEPRRGSFLDIYSAAVAGESGSGKTATLLFLIGSGLVAYGAKYMGIDPHYPHPKSLGAKTQPLWDAGLMRMATQKEEMLAVLKDVERLIDLRLKQIDTETTPIVLVIDELALLSKTSIGSAIAHTMERISTEGRKCAVYMLASSQTWLAARTGDSSVVRDTLTSAFVHRIKPKQANLLLQDKGEVEKLKKYVKQAGEVLFCPVGDESVVCQMPYTTEADMLMVSEMLASQGIRFFDPAPAYDEMAAISGEIVPKERRLFLEEEFSETIAALPEETLSPELPEAVANAEMKAIAAPKSTPSERLADILREQLAASELDEKAWRKQLSEKSGVSESLIKGIIEGKRELTKQTAKKLIPYLYE